MKKSELRQLIKEVISEIDFPEVPWTHVDQKPTLHLAYFGHDGKIVPAAPDDIAKLDDEFGPHNYGKPYQAEGNFPADETMRYFDMNDVLDLTFEFNIFLTEG